jgi:hypothetical protein
MDSWKRDDDDAREGHIGGAIFKKINECVETCITINFHACVVNVDGIYSTANWNEADMIAVETLRVDFSWNRSIVVNDVNSQVIA